MKKVIKSIPNTITLMNLTCGCLSIIYSFNGMPKYAFWLIVAAAVFDFFDGFAARMLKAYSNIGADLDSLSDVVSFGVAPSMMMLQIMGSLQPLSSIQGFLLTALCLMPALFSALRLAIFNNDTEQSDSFRGLPVPAQAMFLSSYAIVSVEHLQGNDTVLVVISAVAIAIMCALMVSRIPMFSFKFKNFNFEDNALRYLFAFFSVIAVVSLKYAAPAAIVAAYVAVSLVQPKNKKTTPSEK